MIARPLKRKSSKCGRTRPFLTGFHFGGLNCRIARRAAGAAAGHAQRSDGGGGTFHFVLAVLVLSTSHATIRTIPNREIPIFGFGYPLFKQEEIRSLRSWPDCKGSSFQIRNSKPAFPNRLWPAQGDLPLERHSFLIIGIEVHGADSVLSGFAEVTPLEEDAAEQNVRVNQSRIPKDRRLQRSDR